MFVVSAARDSYQGREDRPFYRVTIASGRKPAELVAWLGRIARAYSDDDDVFAEKIELVRGTSSNAITTTGLVEQRGRCYSAK